MGSCKHADIDTHPGIGSGLQVFGRVSDGHHLGRIGNAGPLHGLQDHERCWTALGYIVTANNAVVDNDYPYLISMIWAYGYRADRIVDMIEAAPGLIDIPYIQQMQGDNANMSAELILPARMDLPEWPPWAA